MQGGFLKEKDFKDIHIEQVDDFLRQAYFFPKMLDFAGKPFHSTRAHG